MRSTTGRMIRLERNIGGLTWSALVRKIRCELRSRKPAVPAQEEWRVKYMGKLLEDSVWPIFVVYFNISCIIIHYLSDIND